MPGRWLVVAGLVVGCLAACADPVAGGAGGTGQEGAPDLPVPSDVAHEGPGATTLPPGTSADPLAWGVFLGFIGPFYEKPAAAGDVRVLPESLGQEAGDSWAVDGLVRNDTWSDVGQITVRAEIQTTDGREVDAQGVSPIHRVRPGEPVPFHLAADVDGSEVASVVYTAVPGVLDSAWTRDVTITSYYRLPFGDREPVRVYPVYDKGEAPYPYVWYGSVKVRERGETTFGGVTAFVSHEGKVLAILPFTPAEHGGSMEDVTVSIKDPAEAKLLLNEHLAFWGEAK